MRKYLSFGNIGLDNMMNMSSTVASGVKKGTNIERKRKQNRDKRNPKKQRKKRKRETKKKKMRRKGCVSLIEKP